MKLIVFLALIGGIIFLFNQGTLPSAGGIIQSVERLGHNKYINISEQYACAKQLINAVYKKISGLSKSGFKLGNSDILAN